MREIFFTQDLSISGNSQQLWFLWQKSPPRMRDFFYTGSIIFRQFPATLVFVAESPLPDEGIFLHWIYPFQAISSNFGFCGRKAPPPCQDEGNFFYTGSTHFREFPAILVFVAEKPLRLQDEVNFLHRIYPFQEISRNFGFCGRKALHLPPGWGNFFTLDLSISGYFQQLWFLWQKAPSPPRMREIFFTQDLSISGNFQQFWFLWQKSPLPLGWG